MRRPYLSDRSRAGSGVPRATTEPVTAKHRRKREPRRAWRVLRAALVATLSVYALYVGAINAFLSTSLFDRIVNQDPETILIHYTSGWSLLPGRIHARDLSIRSSDSNVEWRLSLDEVTFDVSFLALAGQRFEVTRARGRGVRMLARQKLDAWPDTAEQAATLPQIEGYPAFSVRPAGPPSLERWDDDHYHLWTVKLEDVIAEDVREVWIDHARFEGSARVVGRFLLKPIRAVEVGPAHVDVREGRVTHGRSRPLAEDVAGTVDLTIDRFDPRFVEDGIFRWITARTELQATLADPATLPFALPGDVYVSSPVEARRLALNVARGVVTDGTRLELAARRVLVAKENLIGTAGLDAVISVTNAGDGDRLRAEIGVADLAIVRADAASVIHAPRISVTADARALDLADAPFHDAHASVELEDVDLDDARVLDPYIPAAAPIEIVGGSARARARLELFAADRRAAGSVELDATALDARLAKMRTRGSFAVLGSFDAYRWETGRLEDARLSLVVTNAALSAERDPTKPKIAADTLRLDARAAVVDLVDPLRALEVSFELPEASIVDVRLLDGYLPREQMTVLTGRSRVALGGRVTIEDHVARGTLHARAKELALQLGDVRVRAAVEARARVHDFHWERGDLAIDTASVVATGVSVTRGADPRALATVEQIAVDVESPGFDFGDPLARVDLRARIAGGRVLDAAAVDAFLPEETAYGFASDDGTFEATARLAIANHVAKGRARGVARRMGIRTSPVTVHGDVEAELAVERWAVDDGVLTLGPSRVAIDSARGRFGRGATSELTVGHVELTGEAKELRLAEPTLRGVDARLVIHRAEMPDARALGTVLLPEGAAVRIASGTARAHGDLRISSSERAGTGEISIEVARGGVALRETLLAGDFGLHATVGGFDPETLTFDLSGSRVTMREVAVEHAAAETRRWKGDVLLERAALRLLGEPGLDAVLRLDADDARPLLGVLLRDSVPKLLVGLADMPRLAGYARLRFAPHALVLSDVSASGGDVALRGAYALYDDDRRGAFVVEKGPFSVGLRLGNDGMTPRFFNLDAWLGAQQRNVAAKAKTTAKPPATDRDR